MFARSKTKPYIHPSQYQLPLIGQRTRFQQRFRWVVVALFYTLAIMLTISNMIKPDWGMEAILIMVWIWPHAAILQMIYFEPNLIITDQEIIVKFLFKEKHIRWDEIVSVDKNYIYTQVCVEKLTLFNCLWGLLFFRLYPVFHVLRPVFRVSHAFSNHREIADFIRYKYEIFSKF